MEEKDRIEKIMLKEEMNSAQFAAEIGIQGSTLSHIINGRNNPSLDVLKKILNRFRTVSSDWLILGVGSMYRIEKQSQAPTLFPLDDETDSNSAFLDVKLTENFSSTSEPIQKKTSTIVQTPSNFSTPEIQTPLLPIVETPSKSVRKIIVYFTDNTFQEFETK
jgi:transcriptional regulator with XRE-family HTH domain